MSAPNLDPQEILSIVEANKVPRDLYPGVLVAIRGYRLDSVGKRGENDIGFFDDLAAIVHADNRVSEWNFNVDPTSKVDNRATLQPGIHMYGPGPHNVAKGTSRMYPAYRQAEVVTVKRFGHGDKLFRDFFGINLHKSNADDIPELHQNTSSWGCLTLPEPTWPNFKKDLDGAIKDNQHGPIDLGLWDPTSVYVSVPLFPIILMEEIERRKGNLVVSKRFF